MLIWGSAQAHQPDISTAMLIERENGDWLLQVNCSLTALQYEVTNHFGEDAYSTPEEFQKLVIQHMRENLSLVFNENESAMLDNAYVRLGHASSVVFELNNVPLDFREVAVSMASFKSINKHKCAFGIKQDETSSERVILDETNGHQSQLTKKNAKFVSEPKLGSFDITKYHYLSFALLIGGFGLRRLYARRSAA